MLDRRALEPACAKSDPERSRYPLTSNARTLFFGPPERLELCGRPNSLVLSFDQMYPVLRAGRLGRGSVSRGLAGTMRKQNLRWPRWLIAS